METAAGAHHIAMLTPIGMGHLIPSAEFAKQLHRRHGISTTFILFTDSPLPPVQASFLFALPPAAIKWILLPPVEDLPAGVKAETRISLTINRSMPSIRDAIKSLHDKKKLSAFLVDLFGTDAFDVAIEFNIPRYIFFPSAAILLSLFLHLPELDETVSFEYSEVVEKIRIPGCIPIDGRDLPEPFHDRKDSAYKWFLHHGKRYRMAEGIIVNTFKELEPGPVEALNKKENYNCQIVYPIGPLIRTSSISNGIDESFGCLNWLAEQPEGSVLYVSFGSGKESLSHQQIIEVALGLEMSKQRFLWVVKCPTSAIFEIQDPGNPLAYLPEGFLDRTKMYGLVVPSWAPQARVLAHKATGGFFTHCGWNSTLESVVSGVPMIVWPLGADQRVNATMLKDDKRVAFWPQECGKVEIANMVKRLMEGEEGKEIRKRIGELKMAAEEALGEDGAAGKAMAALAAKWKSDGN